MSDAKIDPWALLAEARAKLDRFLAEGTDERDGAWWRASVMMFCDHIDHVLEEHKIRDNKLGAGASVE